MVTPTRTSFSTPIYPPFGPEGEFAIWVDGVNLSKKAFVHKLVKRLNNLWYVDITFLGLEDADKLHVIEEKIVKIFASNVLQFRGRIESADEDSDYNVKVKAKGMASRLGKHTTNSGYETTATETIYSALVTAESGFTLDTTDNGAFGDVKVSFDNENNLKGIKNMTTDLDQDWWEAWGNYPYDNTIIHIADSKGDANTYQFYSSGANANCEVASKETETKYLLNSIIVLGSGDGIGQLKSVYFYGTDTRTTLSTALNATATTIALTDASGFPSSGDVWIGCEKVSYSGKSVNNLTGCTRGAAFSGNVEYTENVKANTRGYAHDAGIAVYDAQYTTASPEAGTSIDTYGLQEDSDTRSHIISQNVIDRLAQSIVDNQKDPIERITIKPLDTFGILKKVEVGDTVTMTDSVAGLSGLYQVVGILSGYDENEAEFINIELSNRRITFVDDVRLVQEQTKKLGNYTQGVVTIYAVTHADNCDSSKPLNIRFPIPAEIAGVSNVKLNFKIKPFRAYNDATQTATSSSGTAAWVYNTDTSESDVTMTVGTLTNSDSGQMRISITEASDVVLNLRVYDDTDGLAIYQQNVTFDAQKYLFIITLPYFTDFSGHSLTLSVEDMASNPFSVDVLSLGAMPTKFTHSHSITMSFGIYEDTTPSGNVVVTCGAEGSEASVGTYSTAQNEVDITQQVKDAVTVGTLSWINCKFTPATENMRIEASIYIEVIVKR